MAILSARSLRHEADGTPVLRDFDLEVDTGEIFLLLGGPGAGKTVFLELAAAAYPPSGGTLLVAGLDVAERAGDVRRLVSLVPERTGLVSGLTVSEHLRLFGSLHGLGGQACRERARALRSELGLAGGARVKNGTLNAGTRQRLNLALSLIHRPRLLLLDEPLAGLDPASRREITELIATLPAAGITVILATRTSADVEPIGRRIGILAGGRLIAAGSLAALKQRLAHRSVVRIRTREPLRAEVIQGLVGDTGYALEPHVFEVRARPADRAGALLAHFAGRLDAAGLHIVQAEVREPDLASIYAQLTGERPASAAAAPPEHEPPT